MTTKKTPDLKYCDFKTIFDVSFTLHQVALTLQLDPPRLRAFMAGGGKELETFLLDDPLDVGAYRRFATRLERELDNDEEADDDDRMELSNITDAAEEDYAAHSMIWLFADLHVAFLINKPTNDDERRWAKKAADRLAKWSTSKALRDILGDPLTDSMRIIYETPSALVKLSHVGGLAALFGDWVRLCSRFSD